jgi:AcrR family transcriptional regulator
MARTAREGTTRHKEILDVAQRLVYTKGYEQMTIQDILDELKISKGAFYHYFDSKPALLDGLLERMLTEVEKVLIPIVQAPDLRAIEKLGRYFSTAGLWKTAQKDFLLALLRVWYADENALVRQKQMALAIKRIAPLLTAIVQQGVTEGAFTTAYPDQAGEIILALFQSLGDAWVELLLAEPPARDTLTQLEKRVAAYTETLERVLGAPAGSVQLMDPALLKEWVPAGAV